MSNIEVTVYSTGCPKCKVLKTKLDQKGIKYNESNDVEKVKELGYSTVPILVVNEYSPNIETPSTSVMDFKKAVEWVNNFEKKA